MSHTSTGCVWPVAVIHVCLLLWAAPLAAGQPRAVEPLATVPGPSDPAAPRISASYDTPGSARAVAIIDDIVLVADSDALQVLRVRP